MTPRDVIGALEEVSAAPVDDFANALSELATGEAGDYVARVLDLYRQAMDVYAPAEVAYQAAVRVTSAAKPLDAFATSTNR